MTQKYTINSIRSNTVEEGGVLYFPATFHIVIKSLNQERLFANRRDFNTLAYILFEATVLHEYSLLAFCIMPEHAHILCKPGNIAIKHFIDLVRFRFEFAYKRNVNNKSVWETSFRQDILTDEQIISTAIFILNNPVRNGIATSAIDYPFSFAYGGKLYKP